MFRPRYTLVVTALPLALLVGCSGSGRTPDLVASTAMPAGTCRQAAVPINAVHRAVRALSADKTTVGSARTSLARSSSDLLSLNVATSNDPVSAGVANLVQAIGFLRLGIDTHSYDSALVTRTDDAAKRVAAACRSR